MKRWWGRLEKRRVATESGGDETGVPRNETGDKTATKWLVTNETAATGGVMYTDEVPYTIDVRHLCLPSIEKFCDGGLSGKR